MLYTFGYRGWPPALLATLMQDTGAALVDIRYTPTSPNPQWRQGTLRRTWQERYRHVQALGNANHRAHGGEIVLADYPTGRDQVAALLQAGRPLLLMCACPLLASCHRLLVTEQLCRDLGEQGVHLTRVPPDWHTTPPPGMARIAKATQWLACPHEEAWTGRRL